MYSVEQQSEYEKLVDIIFERKYEIKIKAIDNTSIDEVSYYGLYTTGDRDYDKALREELITRWLTIDEMVEYFKRGKPFRIVRIEDTEEIYSVIHRYLLSWEHRLKNSFNIGNAPIEDLIHLDEFASKIHGYACVTMKVQKTQSSLMNYFNSVGLGRTGAVTIENDDKPITKQHNSLAKIFSEAIITARG